MILPLPFAALLLVVFGVGLVWWLSRRIEVAHAPVPMMVTRIGFPPNLRVANVEAALAMLELRDEIVIPFPRAALVIEFPLTHPALITINSALPQGFTRGELVRSICEEYAHIYAGEEGTSLNSEESLEDRGERVERNRTDGAYGIWGHRLDDLILRSVRWVKQSNGDVRIELHVESKPVPPAAAPPELTGA